MRQPQTKFRNETLAIQNVATLAPGARDLSRGVERMTMDGTDITNPEGRLRLLAELLFPLVELVAALASLERQSHRRLLAKIQKPHSLDLELLAEGHSLYHSTPPRVV
jgi:hypothetical protein